MDDLISRKALLEELDKWINPCANREAEFLSGIATAISEVEAAPTIDPVHAAGACYCRECKHWQEHYDYCKEFAEERNQGDFCSRGQRREGSQ